MNPLNKQVWSRSVVFFLVLALMIFVPAWTLHYWQGWIFWLVFCAAMITISAYALKHDPALARRRLDAGAAAEKETSQKIIQGFASVFVIATFVVSSFDYGWWKPGVSAAASLVADACVLLGFYLMFLTFRANSFAASTIEVEQGQRVISIGPYARVRHPMYSGAVLMFVATPIALGSWWGLAAAGLVCVTIIIRLLDEERILSQQLSGYAAYCDEVRFRLVPRVW